MTTARRVEYLLAYDDNTWDTAIEYVPVGFTAEEYSLKLAAQSRYRRVVLFAVYNDDVGGGDEQ